MAKQNLDIVMSASGEAQVVAAVQKVRQEVHKLNYESKGGSGADAGGIGSFIAKGTTGKSISILRESVAGVGIQMIGTTLVHAADVARDMQAQLAAGDVTSGEMAEKLATTIPIFGSLIDAGRKWRGLLDGTTQEIELINRLAKIGNDFAAFQGERFKVAAEHAKEWAKNTEAVVNATRRIGLGPLALPGVVQQQTFAGAMSEAERSAKAQRDDITAKYAAEAEALRKELAKIVVPDLYETKMFAGESELGGGVAWTNQAEITKAINARAEIQSKIDSAERQRKQELAALDAQQQAHKSALGEQDIEETYQIEQQRKDIIADFIGQVAADEAKARQEKLRLDGHALDAELDQIEKSTEEKVKALRAKTRALMSGASPAEVDVLTAGLDSGLSSLGNEAEAARTAAIQKAANAEYEAMRDAQDADQKAFDDDLERRRKEASLPVRLASGEGASAYTFGFAAAAKATSADEVKISSKATAKATGDVAKSTAKTQEHTAELVKIMGDIRTALSGNGNMIIGIGNA